MKLKKVIRLDSTPLNRAFFTEEGYLIDTPILTTTGIFEYVNSDGSVRRELRLPEEVFDPDSLASYQGKPIIISHDAGLVTKDNVSENSIGTILTPGYQDGDAVRAKITIHDTDEMKRSRLKELSLGYNLDLDETPGEWQGQRYDAIQRNIRINHLALVREARAGNQARLNIDSRDKKIKEGENEMIKSVKKTKRADGILSPEELKKAIEEYKARHAKEEQADAEEMKPEEEAAAPETPVEEEKPAPEAPAEEPEDKVAAIKAAHEARKEDEGPDDLEKLKGESARQDEDLQTLLDIIDTLLAERDFKEAKPEPAAEDGADKLCKDSEEEEAPMVPEENKDAAEEEKPENEEDKPVAAMNADSIDAIVRERVKIGIAAEKLNLDGLENLSLIGAKKAIIKAVRPAMNLDGKGSAYINAAFDYACNDVNKSSRKGTDYQRKQMFNKDAAEAMKPEKLESASARERMINRQKNNNKED